MSIVCFSVNKLVSQKWKFSLPDSCFVSLFCNTLDGWDKIREISSKFEIFYQQLLKKKAMTIYKYLWNRIKWVSRNELIIVFASNCIWNRQSSCPDFLLNFWKHFLSVNSCSIVIAHIIQVFYRQPKKIDFSFLSTKDFEII
jgi:hypothetical protein